MNHATHRIGDATSVTSRFGSENGRVRAEKLKNVLCFNNSGALADGNAVYLQIHEITNSAIPNGTTYSGGGSYTLSGLTAGHVYSYNFGANDTSITNGSDTILAATGAGTFTAAGTSVTLAGTISAIITVSIEDTTVLQNAKVPAEGAVPEYSFPVFSKTGGTLGEEVDMSGIYCCWSTTEATKTLASAVGSIQIVIKG